jgi:hypothetical protein
MNRLPKINRRNFLRAAGVGLALPMLEGMKPFGRFSQLAASTTGQSAQKRLVCIGNPYGMVPQRFFPTAPGKDYLMPPLLSAMERHRNDFTIFSNFDHGVSGGHQAADTFLTGVKTMEAHAMPEGNISLDQKAAEFVGTQTRFPVLNLGVGGNCEMSWTRTSINVPTINKSREVFQRLFVEDTAVMKKRLGRKNKLQGSILDAINEQAHSLNRRLGNRDQDKLEEYLESIRDVEKRLKMNEHWLHEPKPAVGRESPEDGEFVESLPVFYDLMALALQTDSTRVITLEMPEGFDTTYLGLKNSYHGYSHHGQTPELLEGLTVIEAFMVESFSNFLDKLKGTELPEGGTLFDSTQILFGSGMGNGSSHSNKNLPIILAGGGYRHQGHVRLPEEKPKRVPLCNLYVTVLQSFGMETDVFNASTGTYNPFV